MTWSERFDAYVQKTGLSQAEVALALKVAPSFVHYWRRGSVPRDEKTRRKIERWSKGQVPAEESERKTGTEG
jgi:ribosome-binding protein aMBF1 (putative translation factor)